MSIKLDAVTKRFGDLAVVDGVALDVEDGEMFVLLGASGSGKSTILRLVAGLSSPDEGRIALHGNDVTDLPPQERGVGFVFQNYSIFRHMTVAENVEFGLRIRGVARRARATRRDELLELVELGGLGDRRPHELSGGQLQRVALARALAYEPRVLLLDEPFGALDVKIRGQLRKSLAEVHERTGVTTLLVTHDQEEAFELADRIGVIERGRLVEVGTAEDLYARPRSGWTATFVGAGSVFLGRVQDQRARLGSLSLELPSDVPHDDGGWVRVLVRPEQFRLADIAPGSDVPTLGQGEVVARVFAGASTHVRLRVPKQKGIRQIAPPLPFGEADLLVEASVPSTMEIPEAPWVSLTGWHVLAQPAARLLILGDASAEKEPFVEHVRDAIGATITLAPPAGAEPEAGPPRTRFYDLAVLVTEANGESELAEQVLRRRLDAPLLLVPRGSAVGKGVLACTAAGEPGKSGVRIAGWLARRLEETVTVVHVWTRHGEPPAWIQRHLARGRATLRAQGAEAEVSLCRARSPLAGILGQLRSGGQGVVVVGLSAPSRMGPGTSFALRILREARRPVLVVSEDTV